MLHQGGFDDRAVRIELIEHTIQPVVVDAADVQVENIAERGAPHPIRHGVFGGRSNQPVEHHGTSQLPHRLGQAAVVQNTVKIETLPELKADVNQPGFPMLLSRNPRRIEGAVSLGHVAVAPYER